jgi:DNA-binding NarL/FixJ family response regulator
VPGVAAREAAEPGLGPVLGAAEVRALMWGPDAADSGGGAGEGSRTLRVEEAARLRAAGLSNKEIAALMGVNASTVGRWLRQAGEHRAGQQ